MYGLYEKEKLRIASIVIDSFEKNNFMKVAEMSRLGGGLDIGKIE